MPGTPTPILNLVVPTVGGDTGAWGTELNGNFQILDSLGVAQVTSISANFTAVTGIFPESIILCTSGITNIAVSLPSPATCKGKIFLIKKIDAGIGSVSVAPASGTIDGQNPYVINNQYSFVRVISDGVNFDVIASL